MTGTAWSMDAAAWPPLPGDAPPPTALALHCAGVLSAPASGPFASRALDRRRSSAILAVAGVAIAFALWFLNRRQPLPTWLFWRFAAIYGLVLFFALACLSAGHAILAWPCRRDAMVPAERCLLDMAAGVLVFGLGTFVVGVAGGLGAAYFWLFPAALTIAGAPLLLRDGSAALAGWFRDRSGRKPALDLGLVSGLATGLGAVGLVFVYLPILTTENIAYDARWYHLAIAEHYAAAGRIGAFPEGWLVGAIPHFASWLYTWALTGPGFDLYTKLELAAHLEFFLFLLTLAAVPLLVARLTGALHARGTWAVFFLFPGLFLYDSSLASGADHILAFWAAPVALSALWLVGAFRPGRAIVLAIACAGAALTKIQSPYLLVPTALFVLGCGARRVVRGRESLARIAYVLAVPLLGTFLCLTASYWLANTIWHHNPVYPLLPDLFPSRPWRSVLQGGMVDPGWRPGGTLANRLQTTLLAPFEFAFVPHDWFEFHRDLPVFGFLFTFSLPILVFLRPTLHTRRIWLLTGGTVVGLLIWFWTYHQDRYLQALLPWMVAVTAAVFLLAWRTGVAARIAVAGLVGLQLIWAGDIPFLPARDNDPTITLEKSIHLLSSTFRNDTIARFDAHAELEGVASALPKDSVVLLHLTPIRLGIGHPTVTDNPRWTAAPLLGSLEGPAAAWRQLREWRVTHLVLMGGRCMPEDLDLESELATHYLAEVAGAGVQYVANRVIVKLSEREPQRKAFPNVLYCSCSRREPVAWHGLDAVFEQDRAVSSPPASGLPAVTESLFAGLDAAVVDQRCPIAFPASLAGHWKRVAQWKDVELWLRKHPASPAP